MSAAAMPPMFFKKPDDVPKKRQRRTMSHHVRTIRQVPNKIRDRVTQELYKRNAELAARNKTLALLRRLDEVSLGSDQKAEMASKMVQAISEELGYEVVSIAMIESKGKHLEWVACASNVPDVAQRLTGVCPVVPPLPLTMDSKSVQAVREGKQAFAENLSSVYPKELVDAITDSLHGANATPIEYSMLLPLRFGDRALGLLTLSTGRLFKNVSEFEHESINGIVGLISLALYKAKIYEDLQKTSAELVIANQQLKDLDKAKSEFLSIASHQLYTPLTALRGYISMIMEGDYGPVSEEQKPVLDILNKSTLRLIELIKDLLDISRIESGRLELHLESIDIVEIAKGLVADLLPNAIAKKLQLTFHDPTEQIPHVVVDSQRIRQVMLNFIDNAIKYTTEGNVDVFVTHSGEKVIFSVQDTGRGLKPNEVDSLFKKFSRVGGAARFNTEGTGLGLYVAKQIVHEHHGEVMVKSPGENKGSTFSMELFAEGAANSLKVGEAASVVIKAAEAQGQQEDQSDAQTTNP